MTGSHASPPAPQSTLVVLLMPELIADKQNVARLRDALTRKHRPVRVLVRVANAGQLPFAEEFSRGDVETQLLLAQHEDIPAPAGAVGFARVPQGGDANDIDELAFALSDVVLADSTAKSSQKQVRRARELGKTVIEPGDPLPTLPDASSVASGLDPESGGWCSCSRHIFGRLEQATVEFFAFDLFNAHKGGRARSWGRLKACFGGKWRPGAYFAPPTCESLAPDPTVVEPTSALVRCFETLDRSALHGSYIHRDLIWAEHALAACAVLAAAVGVVYEDTAVSPWVEFGVLVSIAVLVTLARRTRLNDRWLACRMAAEQLRIARMCLPLMVVPPALISVDTPLASTEPDGEASDLTFQALSEVKRAVRDHGLPRQAASGLPDSAVDWLECIVGDQITYHDRNHRKLHRAERGLRLLTNTIFLAVVVAVLAEIVPAHYACVPELKWLPLVTAAGPAFAAAVHGAATRLGIVHRIELSRMAERDLRPVRDGLADIRGRPVKTAEVWTKVRDLAFRAAEAMGRENTSWHGQVRLQRDSLPS